MHCATPFGSPEPKVTEDPKNHQVDVNTIYARESALIGIGKAKDQSNRFAEGASLHESRWNKKEMYIIATHQKLLKNARKKLYRRLTPSLSSSLIYISAPVKTSTHTQTHT